MVYMFGNENNVIGIGDRRRYLVNDVYTDATLTEVYFAKTTP